MINDEHEIGIKKQKVRNEKAHCTDRREDAGTPRPVDAVVFFVIAFAVGVVLVVATRVVSVSPPAIVHDGPLVITQAEVIEHDKHGMCNNTIAQDDGGDEFDVKFRYVARCDKHHVWDRLALNHGRE